MIPTTIFLSRAKSASDFAWMLWMSLFNRVHQTCQTVSHPCLFWVPAAWISKPLKWCWPRSHINTVCLSVPIHISLETSLCSDSTLAEPKRCLEWRTLGDVCLMSQSFCIVRPHSVHKVTHRSVALILLFCCLQRTQQNRYDAHLQRGLLMNLVMSLESCFLMYIMVYCTLGKAHLSHLSHWKVKSKIYIYILYALEKPVKVKAWCAFTLVIPSESHHSSQPWMSHSENTALPGY